MVHNQKVLELLHVSDIAEALQNCHKLFGQKKAHLRFALRCGFKLGASITLGGEWHSGRESGQP
jgi:hypothetical protein